MLYSRDKGSQLQVDREITDLKFEIQEHSIDTRKKLTHSRLDKARQPGQWPCTLFAQLLVQHQTYNKYFLTLEVAMRKVFQVRPSFNDQQCGPDALMFK